MPYLSAHPPVNSEPVKNPPAPMVSILDSKLLVPDVSETIARERLDGALEEIPRRKLTTVVAGAGYGKTTLVAQAIRNSKWESAWYRLGETDRDPVIFLSYGSAQKLLGILSAKCP
ncbi:MAG: hypothetical protein GY866_00550, partial [Proteobacteria bacterium]|nr:hypothetical protein [Pseudomonadota bacterium]